MSASRQGFVSLVGAGPGDPELWTVRALTRVQQADLVLYDALIDAVALHGLTRAQCFCVGKRAGRASVRQETIHRLMIRAARQGKRVVRLKGGDPFVFGRGAEEAIALREAGIAFEIVPGVTTAVAAAELAGIPVTHRGVSTGFLVLAGHSGDALARAIGGVRPDAVTVVVMMGLGRIEQIAHVMLVRGWNPLTPAAVIFGASTSESSVQTLALKDLERAVNLDMSPNGNNSPATIVICDVVRLGALLSAQAAADEAAVGGN